MDGWAAIHMAAMMKHGIETVLIMDGIICKRCCQTKFHVRQRTNDAGPRVRIISNLKQRAQKSIVWHASVSSQPCVAGHNKEKWGG